MRGSVRWSAPGFAVVGSLSIGVPFVGSLFGMLGDDTEPCTHVGAVTPCLFSADYPFYMLSHESALQRASPLWCVLVHLGIKYLSAAIAARLCECCGTTCPCAILVSCMLSGLGLVRPFVVYMAAHHLPLLLDQPLQVASAGCVSRFWLVGWGGPLSPVAVLWYVQPTTHATFFVRRASSST
jgi:hypothetical protein